MRISACTRMHVPIHVFVPAYTHARMHAWCVRACVHACYVRACVCASVRACTCAQYACARACACTTTVPRPCVLCSTVIPPLTWSATNPNFSCSCAAVYECVSPFLKRTCSKTAIASANCISYYGRQQLSGYCHRPVKSTMPFFELCKRNQRRWACTVVHQQLLRWSLRPASISKAHGCHREHVP